MDILAIDIGSYSIKFIESKTVKRRQYIDYVHEIVLSKLMPSYSEQTPLEEIQLDCIQNYLEHRPFNGKIIFQVPNTYLTTRYLDLPINNKKKAEMMVPFQLDESLPFPLSSTHYIHRLKKIGNTYAAVVNITNQTEFDSFYGALEKRHIFPSLLTSELASLESFAKDNKLKNAYCFLDIGHSSTKAYFFQDHHMMSNHISYTAGKSIDEIIEKTYDISREDAVIYKHQNCFFLTENQYDEVTDDQKEFADLMKKTLAPLVTDFKRWEMGFRTKHGIPLTKVYLIGGSSNINNIENFLSQELILKVEKLEYYNIVQDPYGKIEESESTRFAVAQVHTHALSGKYPPLNFLTGHYSTSVSSNIPLHSSIFTGIRITVVCAILILTFMIEAVFLSLEEKALNNQLMKMVKNPALDIPKKQQRMLRAKPERLLSLLQKQHEDIKKEISTVMSADKEDAMSPLATLSKHLNANEKVDLVKFKNDYGNVEAIFKSSSLEELTKLERRLKTSSFKDLNVQLTKKDKVLQLNFTN